jgi:hypothetical protein
MSDKYWPSSNPAAAADTEHLRQQLQTLTIQVWGPIYWIGATERITPEMILETEENLTDLLPPGYSVRIKEWDAREETA